MKLLFFSLRSSILYMIKKGKIIKYLTVKHQLTFLKIVRKPDIRLHLSIVLINFSYKQDTIASIVKYCDYSLVNQCFTFKFRSDQSKFNLNKPGFPINQLKCKLRTTNNSGLIVQILRESLQQKTDKLKKVHLHIHIYK